jgi:hypothetical protein
METGECLKVLEGHKSTVNSLVLSADGRRVVSGSYDNTLRIWDMETGQCLQVLEGHTSMVSSLVLSADGRRVVSGSNDNTLRIWDMETGQCLGVHFLRGIRRIEYQSSKGAIVIGFCDGRVEFYHIENLPLRPFVATAQREVISQDLPAGPLATRPLWYYFENLPLGPFITNAHREVISEDLPAGPTTARPPCCGQLISVPPAIADRIEHWTLNSGEGGYSDPALLLDCPNCQTPLRMNPFFVDVRSSSI